MMTSTRIKNVQRNAIWSAVNQLVVLLMSFLSRTTLIYVLGNLYLGLNGLFSSILSMLALAELGFGAAMVFSMYEPLAKGDSELVCALLNLYRKIYRIIGIIILVGGLAMMPFLPRLIKGEVPADVNLYVIYLVFLGNSVLSYFLYAYKQSLLIADQRTDITSNIASLVSIASNGMQIVVLLLFRNYYAFCILFPIFTIISNLVTHAVTNRRYPQYQCHGTIERNRLVDIKKRVMGLFLYKLCYVFRDSIDNIFISAYLGLTLLGQYSNYIYISTTLIGVFAIIKTSITASVGNSIVEESVEKNYHDFKKGMALYMWFSIWATACLLSLYQPFIALWTGAGNVLAWSIMALIVSRFFCYSLGDMCAVYRHAGGLWWHDRFRPITESIVKVILNFALISTIGLAGALISTIFCLIFINSIWASWVLYRYYFKPFSQWEYIGRIIFYILVAITTAGITALLCHYIPLEGIGGLISRAAVCLIVPPTMLFATFRLLPEFPAARQMFLRLLHRS